MSDDDTESSPVDLDQPEEEASRLKALAAEEYTSGNVEAAVKHAERAHKLHPSLDGLPEMLAAFKILRTAAAPISETTSPAENSLIDYYEILGVKQFSHIDVIKKQYKKLAMTMHPDKNPSAASEEAFKLVGEAARVLSDRIRRKEYDTRLRVALQSIASKVSGLATEETFRTVCSTCQGLHQFDRRYLGHNLVCPSCKKTFKAVEVEEGGSNEAALEKNESVGVGVGVMQTRESARLKERVARGESIGIVERCGLGMKRKVGQGVKGSTPKVAITSVDDDYLLKDLVPKILDKKVVKLGEEKGGGDGWNGEIDVENGLSRDGVDEAAGSGVAEVVESERTERAQSMEEGNMTLLQMKMLVKKKKLDEGRVEMSGKKVDSENMKAKKKNKKKRAREGDVNGEREYEKEKGGEIENGDKMEEENEKVKENEEIVERDENLENEEDNEEGVGRENRREKENEKKATRKGKKKRIETLNGAERDTDYEKEKTKEEIGSKKKRELEKEKKATRDQKKKGRETLKEVERDTDYEKEKSEEEIGSKKKREVKNKENGEVNKMENTREKRVRRCVSRYGSLETLQSKTSNDHADKGIEPHAAKKQGNLEILPVEASDFHDFDKDRTERSFKKGQVWAVYDDSDGMPRHYALIDEIVSVHPFEVTLIWLQVDSSGQGESSTSRISCGSFKTANKASIKYLNLFSHVVDYARAARQVYRIYPKKGSIWALYNDSASDAEGRNQIDKNKQSFDIVVCLSTYSNVHGLSIAHLEKVPGFKTVFKRRAIGANAVVCLGKDDVKQFSHEIPSKKLSNKESPDLPKDCWELDPASLTPEFLRVS